MVEDVKVVAFWLLEGRGLPVRLGNGGVGEWLNPAVLKTVRPERVSGVRIPPPPPYSRQLYFSALTTPRNIYFAGRKAAIARS